jgi:hypothetical protein
MTFGRGANLTCLLCRKDHLLDEQPRGTICQNNERARRYEGSVRQLNNLARGALAQVAKEYARCRSWHHCEVSVVRLEDRGVGVPPTYVADVY